MGLLRVSTGRKKAVKAVYLANNRSVKGHGILKMLHFLQSEGNFEIGEELLQMARILDRYYIEARYPIGFPTGKPANFDRNRHRRPSMLRKRSSSSVEVTSIDHDQLIRDLESIAVRIGSRDATLVEIRLYGSLLTESYTEQRSGHPDPGLVLHKRVPEAKRRLP